MSNTETPQEQNPQEPLLGNEPAIEPVVEPIVAEHTDTLPSVEEQFRALELKAYTLSLHDALPI